MKVSVKYETYQSQSYQNNYFFLPEQSSWSLGVVISTLTSYSLSGICNPVLGPSQLILYSCDLSSSSFTFLNNGVYISNQSLTLNAFCCAQTEANNYISQVNEEPTLCKYLSSLNYLKFLSSINQYPIVGLVKEGNPVSRISMVCKILLFQLLQCR